MTGFHDNDLPLFGVITDIIVVSEKTPLLAVDLYKTMGINTHVAAYQIFRTNDKSLILLSDLTHKQTLSSHQYIADGNTYITLRSHIPNY